MDYREFKEEILKNIKGYLPKERESADVKIVEVTKNNDSKREALVIVDKNSAFNPSIYLNSFFRDYLSGESMEDVLSTIAKVDMKGREEAKKHSWDVNNIMDYEQIKGKIFPRLINAERNSERLENMPHKDFLDLAVVYYLELGDCGEEASVSSGITNSMMKVYGIDIEELHEAAFKNLQKKKPALEDVAYLVQSMLSPEESKGAEGKLYVLTTEDRFFGAVYMLDEEIMKDASAILGGSFNIIPSSVHEVLFVGECEEGYLHYERMLHDVNDNFVEEDEILSYNMYKYDAARGMVIRADSEIVSMTKSNEMAMSEAMVM